MKKIRILALALVSVVLMSFMTVAPFAAEEPQNLIVNGTFESGLDGWNYKSGTSTWQDGYATLPAESATFLGQDIYSFSHDVNYLFQFDVKSYGDCSDFLVYVEYFNKDRKQVGNFQSINSNGEFGTEWKTKAFILNIPEETHFIRIWFRNNDGAKQASYDNVSLTAYHFDGIVNPEANLDMNTTDSQGFPVGYKTTGTVTAEPTTVYDGTGLKLSNTESDAVSTVTGSLITPPKRAEEHYELLVSYKLFDVPADTSGGAKLSIKSVHGKLTPYTGQDKYNSTDYFVKNSLSDDGWRQMMVMFINGGMWIDFTVELSGIGTLYIDEITLRKASYIVNGDLLGRSSDYAPAGWTNFAPTWATSEAGISSAPFLAEELSADGKTYNNYVVDQYNYNTTSLKQNIYFVDGESVGDIYKISGDFKSTSDYGLGIRPAEGLGNYSFWTTKNNSTTFINKEAYVKCEIHKVFALQITGRDAAKHYYDNIKMEKVLESVSFMQNGVEVTEAVSGDIAISYRRPGTSFDDNDSVTMVAAVYAHKGNTTTLHSIQMLTDKATFVNTLLASGVYSGPEPATGYRPVMLDHTVNVPEAADGVTYSVKAMFWDGASTMHPVAAKATLPAVTQ